MCAILSTLLSCTSLIGLATTDKQNPIKVEKVSRKAAIIFILTALFWSLHEYLMYYWTL